MFSQVSVYPQGDVADTPWANTPWMDTTQGRHPLAVTSPGRHPPGQTPPGRHTPPGQTHTPWADTHPLGRHSLGQTHTPWADTHPLGRHTHPWAEPHPWADIPPGRHPPIRSISGWYASYSNAFLFINEILWQESQTTGCINTGQNAN